MFFMRILKKWQTIIFLPIVFVLLIQLCSNLRQGYLFFPPFRVETPMVLVTFQSHVKPFSIEYPRSWLARNALYGNHGDMEIIAMIKANRFNAPTVVVAHKEIVQATLEQVAEWGEGRLRASSDALWIASPLKKVTLDGKSALLRTFHTKSSLDSLCYHTYLLNRNDAYVVQMCMSKENQSPELEDLFNQMINSIRF